MEAPPTPGTQASPPSWALPLAPVGGAVLGFVVVLGLHAIYLSLTHALEPSSRQDEPFTVQTLAAELFAVFRGVLLALFGAVAGGFWGARRYRLWLARRAERAREA